MKRVLLFGLPLTLLLGGYAKWLAFKPKSPTPWWFAQVERGDMNRKVTATGTLNALTQVSVGTKVSGVVTALYTDFNSVVKKGQIVACIDPSVNETLVANALSALRKAQAAADLAKADLARYQVLANAKLVAPADLEAKANTFEAAMGEMESAKADLARARINLGYCATTAPVDGVVVVSRVVDVGQTVAANPNTPSLFTIAKDL